MTIRRSTEIKIMSAHQMHLRASFGCGMLIAWLLVLCSTVASATTQPGDVDLSPTPPDLTASVDPNIVVTFDDSGSMASNFMGDFRPFDNGSWTGPWFCAGSIDPRVTSATNIKSHSMNGVYYNALPPSATTLLTYTTPVKEDNSIFPSADASLTRVWADGIAINRPANAVAAAAATYLNNPQGPSTTLAGDNRVGNLMGVKTVTPGSNRGNGVQCPANADSGSCRCTGSGSGRTCSWTVTTDNRWQCGYSTSPMDGVTVNPDGGTYPNGGPYYYRLKSTVSIPVDTFGNPTSAGRTALYTATNWEAVPVPTSEYQNFANWYAYYRTRNLMTRSALSRVFGQFGDNIRATWQNINNGTFNLPSTTIITNLNDTNSAAANYRKQFFDWVFSVGASGSTPNRASTIRAGNFFTRANTQNLRDPYWEPGQGTQPGRELACRQNFHMLVTDGYWHEGNPSAPSGFFTVQNPPGTLPDGTTFSRSDPTSRVFWNVPASPSGSCSPDPGGTDCYPSLADIAFFYWAKDLRTDLANTVPPYLPDKTTQITGSTPLQTGDDPLQNREIYYNPVNDPASWQHVVQFMVTLGIAGQLQFSDDTDCTNPQNDLCKLRKGQSNSAGITGWPIPANNDPKAIDDTWHAAINSRGSYFSASNPTALVQHLTDIINNILSRKGSSTALSATMSTLTAGTQGYSAGYDTSDYSGFLIKQNLDPDTGEAGATIWDAGCFLTGGTFSGGVCTLPPGALPDASIGRRILTANDSGTTSRSFTSFTSLTTAEQVALNQDPNSTTKCTSQSANTNGCDGNGQIRADWLRGVRTNETVPPLLRHRSSVLGAIINSQPRYVSAPTGGFSDNFPPGSPEAIAATPDANGVPGAGSYAQYVNNNRNRQPTVYVGANDGMMHAFDGVTGAERWAYMPMTLFGVDGVSGEPDATVIAKRRLAQTTNTAVYKNAPTVDNTAVVQDVFMGGAWHTVLVGTLRYGGRGVYALDITDPTAPTFLWERNYTMSGFQHLGYTYAYPNIGRVSYNGGKWVVLLASGYFPLPDLTPPDPVSNDTAANQTSLFVIDLQSGNLIREIQAGTAPTSFAMSTPAVYDLNSDEVDDIAVAGDLAGNLWRFDLSSASSGSWTVDLMFKTYTSAGEIGRHPISAMPVGLRDPVAQAPMWVFGSGKFLGLCDRTASSPPSNCGPDANTATQAFFGVRDYGTASTNYPILPTQLNSWTIAEDSSTHIRSLSGPTVVTNNRGWTIPLDSAQTHQFGERVVVNVVPFYSANYAILTTLIPSGNDPCSPDRLGAIMAVDGGTGGPLVSSPLGGGGPSGNATNAVVGQVVNSRAIPIAGITAVVGSQGGPLLLPGLPQFQIPAPPPHRGSWRSLLDLL
jgi:type IV pilus assembly protein PilY1